MTEGIDTLRISVPPTKGAENDPLFYAIQALKKALPDVLIQGLPSITRTLSTPPMLKIEGSGLKQVMVMPGINGTQTTSNNTAEIAATLGIEAARASIIHEIGAVMASHGMTIDPRHMALMADLMTFKGEVLGITRFGIAKLKDSVLMLASFEKTSDHVCFYLIASFLMLHSMEKLMLLRE